MIRGSDMTDFRLHAPPDSKPRAAGEFVLYWMQTTQRAHDNFAVNFAIEQADALGLPVLVYHGLRHDYPWASDRFHTWILEGVIDLYAGFTPCLRLIRACAKAGVPLDLHAGFPMDMYHFPLYGFVDDKVLPWIGWHSRSPKWVPVATEFRGSETNPQRQPWLKRVQSRPVDAEGYVRLVYELPGMGIEPDWEWIKQHEIQR